MNKDLKTLHSFLGFFPKEDGLQYKLSSYTNSGLNNFTPVSSLHLKCSYDLEQWELLKNNINGFSPLSISKITNLNLEDFVWLIASEDKIDFNDEILFQKSIEFINSEKLNFQSICTNKDEIYFDYDSNINTFIVTWTNGESINYIYLNQD